jgi:hypothetical protein
MLRIRFEETWVGLQFGRCCHKLICSPCLKCLYLFWVRKLLDQVLLHRRIHDIPGVDLMKQFRPKFTDEKNGLIRLKVLVFMDFLFHKTY